MEEREVLNGDASEPKFKEGFYFIELPESESPPQKNVQPEPETVEHEQPPDHILSHHERIEAKNACFEPIYVDGKHTGE